MTTPTMTTQTMTTRPTRQPTVAVAVHDGYYGCGTGAGYSNHAFLTVLTELLSPDVRLIVLPVRLDPTSPEYDPAWHTASEKLLATVDSTVVPVDNGTDGQLRFGGPGHFRQLVASTARTIDSEVQPHADPLLVVAFDIPFFGLPLHLPAETIATTVLVPRSSGHLHDPTNTDRIAWETAGLHAAAQYGGRVAAISAHMRDHLHQTYEVPAGSLVELRDGLTPHDWDFQPADPALLPPGTNHSEAGFLLAMGRAHPYKGWDDLLDAFELLHRHGQRLPPTLLAAVTEDPAPSAYQRHLANRAQQLDQNIALHTRFDARIRNLLTHPALRAVVVPSRTEPFGRIPLEAYAAGAAPVIATTAGGLAEQVINGVTGYTANPADPPNLAQALRHALTIDEHQRRRLRTAGRELARTTFDHTRSVRDFFTAVAPWALHRAD